MNIRYRVKYPGGVATSIYSIEDLEDENLITSMHFLNNSSVEILSKDLGTEMFDEYGNEAFENDGVILKSGQRGVIKWKPGGFYIKDTPLGNVEIKTIIKEV